MPLQHLCCETKSVLPSYQFNVSMSASYTSILHFGSSGSKIITRFRRDDVGTTSVQGTICVGV